MRVRELWSRLTGRVRRFPHDAQPCTDRTCNTARSYGSRTPINGTGENETVISIFPLHPALFMPRILAERGYHKNIAMRPYIVHANWADSVDAKRAVSGWGCAAGVEERVRSTSRPEPPT